MLDKVDVSPTPPLPRRWTPIIASVVIVALVVAYFTVPPFRRDVVFVWEAGVVMLKKLFRF